MSGDHELAFDQVAAQCREQGLIAAAVIAPPAGLDPLPLDRMLADGVGDMAWLASQRALRLQPQRLVPAAQSLVLALLPYTPVGAGEGLRRASYASGKDYHKLFRSKLVRVGAAIAAQLERDLVQRATVDSAPVNERQLAHLAGLGWIGRNALLLRPGVGSCFFIGGLFTSARLELRHGKQDADRCGSCRACEQRCPTAAIADRRVHSERCISYLTIEHQGVIPRQLAERFEGWWFGCDLCQEVCPWNRYAPPAGAARLLGATEAAATLGEIPGDVCDRHFAGRAIRRLGYERLRRNLLVALWSLGQHQAYRPILEEGLPLVRAQAAELGVDLSPSAP
jgi:epoxyqueuosine reductase